MALHLRPRKARVPLKVYNNGEPVRFRDLTEEELAKVNTGGRSQRHVMLLDHPEPGGDLTYAWDNRETEVWVRWPSPNGGHFVMRIDR